jgi:hypothetical protein
MIHVVGDSHIMLFTGRKPLPWLLEVPLPEHQPVGYDLTSSFLTYFCVLVRAYHIIPNTTSPQAATFFKIVESLPQGSNVLIVAGEIDCRGPIINEANRKNKMVEWVACECAERFLTGVQKVKDMGMKPIIYAPTPNMFTDSDVRSWLALPEYLTSSEWCFRKMRAVKTFSDRLKQQDSFPVVSLVDWIMKEGIVYKREYWADLIHMSEKVWDRLIFEFKEIGYVVSFEAQAYDE